MLKSGTGFKRGHHPFINALLSVSMDGMDRR
jgi:hypothetical protein